MVGKWNGSVDIYENHDRRCILFSVLGRMLSRNRHGQEKSHRIAFLSDEVQTRVQSDPQLGQAVPKAKSTAAILLSNLLLFTVVFSVLGLALKSVLGLNSYLSAWQRK